MKFISILFQVTLLVSSIMGQVINSEDSSSLQKVTFPGQKDKMVMAGLEKALLEEIKKNELLIPALVQTLFHDCVPFCDGCVDVTNGGNRGLDGVLDLLLKMKTNHAASWSQADVNVYCGLRAAREAAIRAGGDLQLQMHINRRTCQGGLPRRAIPFGGHNTGLQTLIDLYKLTKPQAVALLGAHSLGGCSTVRSGYSGGWDRTPTALDNGYFFNLLNQKWKAGSIKNANINSHQWGIAGNVGGSPMMLNTDMAIIINFKTGKENKPNCDLDTCPPARRTARIARRFAGNMNDFHKSFQKGLQKIVTTGYTDLHFVDFI